MCITKRFAIKKKHTHTRPYNTPTHVHTPSAAGRNATCLAALLKKQQSWEV